VAAGLLVLATGLSNVVDTRERRRSERGLPARLTTAQIPAATGEYQLTPSPEGVKVTVSQVGPVRQRGSFELIFSDRYLLLIALLMLVLTGWTATAIPPRARWRPQQGGSGRGAGGLDAKA
jgi:hypothetical protein